MIPPPNPHDAGGQTAGPSADGQTKAAPLRVLVVEDNVDDYELILRALRRAGFDPQGRRIATEAEFLLGMEAELDLILADYTLPDFDGLRALHLLRQSGRETPFIIVSGTIGEERAVRAIKEGAADYLLKDRLARLGPAVNHALEQRVLRDEHRQIQEHLRARQEAERANAAKSEFLSRLSHELRTPLNAILGFGQLLETDNLSESQAESVLHILGAGRHLLHLVNEVLDISSVESGSLSTHCEEVNLHLLLQETVALIRSLAAMRQIEVHLGEPPPQPCGRYGTFVFADPQRLRQVLLNLLSNAVKYNQVGGRVVLDYRMGIEKLRLRVADTGPGIAEEKRSRLFVPFDRLGAEDRGIEGTGLGLTLSKALMDAMGGTLGLESQLPECEGGAAVPPATGAVFWIELPRAAVPAIIHSQEAAPLLGQAAGEATEGDGVHWLI